MSDCRFQFEFPGTGIALVETLRTKMTVAGGSFDGSDSAGSFSLPTPIGQFGGDYSIQGKTIRIEVSAKPIFVPCSAIEAKLEELVRRHQ